MLQTTHLCQEIERKATSGALPTNTLLVFHPCLRDELNASPEVRLLPPIPGGVYPRGTKSFRGIPFCFDATVAPETVRVMVGTEIVAVWRL